MADYAFLDSSAEGTLEGSLRELVECTSLKWIFVGGKGGVGKTTTSCTLAVQLAARRESVLVVSTDPAHNISDAFGQKFSGEPSLVKNFTNLYAMEISSNYQENLAFNFNNLHAADVVAAEDGSKSDAETGERQTFSNFSLTTLVPEMLQAVPGIDEALSFAELMQSVQTMKHDVIVFDTAPTGHTLRLLSFPDLLEKGLRKLSLFKDKIQAALRMLSVVSGQQIQEQDFAAKIDNLKALTTSVRETFQDAARTTFVCVCVPEFLSLYETERLIQALAKQKIDCSNIVVNQVLFPIEFSCDGVGKEDGLPPPAQLYAASAPLQWYPTNTRELLQDPLVVLQQQKTQEKSSMPLKLENEQLRSFIYAVQRRLLALEKSYYSRRAMQSKYLEQIQLLYAEDFHVVAMPQQSEEVRGLARLQHFGALLLEERSLPILNTSLRQSA